MPAPRDHKATSESAGSVKSIGERVRGLTRSIEAQSVGRRVMAVPCSSRKSARPSMVVTASSKKAKKGEARAATDGVRLGGEEDDLSSFGSPLNLNDRLERGSTVSRTQDDQLRHGRPFFPLLVPHGMTKLKTTTTRSKPWMVRRPMTSRLR